MQAVLKDSSKDLMSLLKLNSRRAAARTRTPTEMHEGPETAIQVNWIFFSFRNAANT
jgi:hypothetical protein